MVLFCWEVTDYVQVHYASATVFVFRTMSIILPLLFSANELQIAEEVGMTPTS